MKYQIPLEEILKRHWFLGTIILFLLIRISAPEEAAHSRQKRLLWITSDGRLALPPGTTLVIAPSLSLPFVRYPPDGFYSNMTISLPFTIDFNKLGLTDNENPYGVLPPLLARSMGRAAGNMLGEYIMKMMDHRRRKRSMDETVPEPPKEPQHAFHGGERALLYLIAEDFLENFGMNGKACLLRAICEVHAHPLHNFGLVGEMIKLFLSASKSPYSTLITEYVDAENAGRGKSGGPAECWPYLKDCSKSLFKVSHNKYSEPTVDQKEVISNYEDLNTKDNEVTYDPKVMNM